MNWWKLHPNLFVCGRCRRSWRNVKFSYLIDLESPHLRAFYTVRLSQMLDSAAIAFLIMIAEDEQSDHTLRARMNVIHEAGLFQGRLGFTRAIILLEEGCENFSNVDGLGYIDFPHGNIKACFEDVRMVLEREGLV